MLTIRLKRVGRTNLPFYRLVVIEKSKSRDGKFLESVGSFDPRDKQNSLKINADRVKYWISQGAEISPVVHNLLVDQKIVTGAKRSATRTHKSAVEAVPPSPAVKTPEPAPVAEPQPAVEPVN